MIYHNCKQVVGPDRTPTSMQSLTRGSIIYFGSTIDHGFCIDTVFVVASAEPWTPRTYKTLHVEEAFKVCTAAPMAAVSKDANNSLTLFRGATFDDSVQGMFSFVPARLAGHPEPRFERSRRLEVDQRPGISAGFGPGGPPSDAVANIPSVVQARKSGSPYDIAWRP